MSSRKFSVDLLPDKRLRGWLLLGGAVSAGIGLVMILHLRLSIVMRVVLLAAWLGWSGRELLMQADGSQRVRRIRLNNLGEVWITDARGRSSQADLLPGSVVLRRIAWLRIRLDCGRKYGELLTENAVQSGQWHRLQLLWQQCRQYFAGTGGS